MGTYRSSTRVPLASCPEPTESRKPPNTSPRNSIHGRQGEAGMVLRRRSGDRYRDLPRPPPAYRGWHRVGPGRTRREDGQRAAVVGAGPVLGCGLFPWGSHVPSDGVPEHRDRRESDADVHPRVLDGRGGASRHGPQSVRQGPHGFQVHRLGGCLGTPDHVRPRGVGVRILCRRRRRDVCRGVQRGRLRFRLRPPPAMRNGFHLRPQGPGGGAARET